VRKVSYRDNPYFPEVLEKERAYLQRVDPDAYDHVWEGNPRHISDACIFRGKYSVETFETPPGVRFYYGADWGFSQDPTVLTDAGSMAIFSEIDFQAWGVGVELDEIPQLFDTVPGSRDWPIRADNSRPETISHIKKKGVSHHTSGHEWSATNVEDKTGKIVTTPSRGAMRTELPISGGLSVSSYTSGALTWWMKQNSIGTRRINSPERFCPLSWMHQITGGIP